MTNNDQYDRERIKNSSDEVKKELMLIQLPVNRVRIRLEQVLGQQAVR